jgi:hypothetical protein
MIRAYNGVQHSNSNAKQRYEHIEYILDGNESILRRFLDGIDSSIRCRSSEGDCEAGSEIGDVENEDTDDSGSKDCSVFTDHSGIVKDVASPRVSELIRTN